MPTTLLEMLAESQQALNEATSTENEKRARLRHTDLEQELALCAQAAQEGYQKTAGHLEAIQALIDEAGTTVHDLGQTTSAQRGAPINDPISQQMQNSLTEMREIHDLAIAEIETNHRRLGTFNIVLFGRTMTGKSTLMEILTEGEGKSIGKGAQRTTRDVRSYEWNGLTITDVPGIAAYGGAQDDRTAIEAAGLADLIIYLITDDGAQEAEAEAVDLLRRTGNPILGICNVKKSVNNDLHIRRFLREQGKVFDPKRLDELVNTFHQLTGIDNQQSKINFKFAHLQARFIAAQPEHRERKTELIAASRFNDIEDQIYDEITRNGSFHRQRNFIETAARATYEIWQQTLSLKQAAYQIHDRMNDHVAETQTWQKQFHRSASTKIETTLKDTIGKLRRDIPAFVELHCENENLPANWERKVRQTDIHKQVRKLQDDLQQEVSEKVTTRIAEIVQELKDLQFRSEPLTIDASKISNHRKAWDWSIQGISGALGIAAIAALPIPPLAVALGIAAGVVQAIGMRFRRMFGNKAKGRQEAIGQIAPELHKNLDEVEDTLRTQLTDWLDKQLIGQQIFGLIQQIRTTASQAEKAARFYQFQVDGLNQRQQELNHDLLEALLSHIGEDPSTIEDLTAARVPGQALALRPTKGKQLARPTVDQLQAILQEPIEIFPSRCSRDYIIAWAFRLQPEAAAAIEIDQSRKLVHVDCQNSDPATSTRIEIAQQLTGLQITTSS